MLRTLVSDWNGTMLADTQLCQDIGNGIIKKYGGTPLTRMQYTRTFFFPAVEFSYAQGSDKERLTPEIYRQEFYTSYSERAPKCRTRKALQWLNERSKNVVILSNHLENDIAVHLERLDLTDYIDEILANSTEVQASTGNNKVHRMQGYVERTGIDPNDVWIVGDSTEDIEIGKKIGFKTVAISGGYFSLPRLRASNPDHVINNMHQLIQLFEAA